MFTSSDDNSPVRIKHSSTDASSQAHRSADLSSPEHHNQHHYCTSQQNTEQFYIDFANVAWDDDATSSKEIFPTAPLDAKVWSEDPIPGRQLCIHETPHKPNHQCFYPCPYSTTTLRVDLPQSTAQGTTVLNYKLTDFSDISLDLPDIMMTSDNDIPHLVDIPEHLDNIQHEAWFA